METLWLFRAIPSLSGRTTKRARTYLMEPRELAPEWSAILAVGWTRQRGLDEIVRGSVEYYLLTSRWVLGHCDARSHLEAL